MPAPLSRDFFVDMPFRLASQFLKVRLGTGGLASYPHSAVATATFRSRSKTGRRSQAIRKTQHEA